MQNEARLLTENTELRKKYGLSHYCMSRFREFAKNFKSSTDHALYSGNMIGAELEEVVNCLGNFFSKIRTLEESPEYKFAQTEV